MPPIIGVKNEGKRETNVTTTQAPTRSQATDPDTDALAFAQAHHRWLRLRAEPLSWTEPDRQRSLAVAFLDYHAAKLALSEKTVETGGYGLR
jgi:hypothetical protein